MEKIMKKSFLLALLISGIYLINISSTDESYENLLIFKELGNNVFRTRTLTEYDKAAHAYITFANRHNYVSLLPSFEQVISYSKQKTLPSHMQVQTNPSSSSSTKELPTPFKYPSTQPKTSLTDKIKSLFRGLSPSPSK